MRRNIEKNVLSCAHTVDMSASRLEIIFTSNHSIKNNSDGCG